MIPKIIHYCWFGGNPLPELAEKCIASWKKYFTDYEIKEWNESNYDVHKIPYIDEAYNAKKYAFVSDYARFDILHQYGGIYFDTDVEAIKSFNDILQGEGFMGTEAPGLVATGLGMACVAGHTILVDILHYYKRQHFINHHCCNTPTVVAIVSEILKGHGFTSESTIQNIQGIKIYPAEYFSPKSFETGITTITEKTYSIHHFDSSWYSKEESRLKHEKWNFYEKYGKDDYLVDVFNKLKYYENRYKNFDIENISLKQLYKISFKKTIKKILGQNLINRIKVLSGSKKGLQNDK